MGKIRGRNAGIDIIFRISPARLDYWTVSETRTHLHASNYSSLLYGAEASRHMASVRAIAMRNNMERRGGRPIITQMSDSVPTQIRDWDVSACLGGNTSKKARHTSKREWDNSLRVLVLTFDALSLGAEHQITSMALASYGTSQPQVSFL